jgi:coniferyl-aldehyde dehydrogenase
LLAKESGAAIVAAEPVDVAQAEPAVARLEAAFEAQRRAFRRHPMPSARERREHLTRLMRALARHADEAVDAVAADFGHRSAVETRGAELMVCMQSARYVRHRIGRWMKPSRRNVGWLMATTRARVLYQPLGVVGIIAPWNYPLQLALVPLCYALAAGNRVLLKPSELTPRTADLLARIIGECFQADHVGVVTGDARVGAAFARLPFDHLLFTGSTAVGREIMKAAAANLTPVTLELGGKSPVLIAPDADLALAGERIAFGKGLNAGQTCVAPDYVLCPRGRVRELVRTLEAAFARMYPSLAGNTDYTCIASARQMERLERALEEARAGGAELIEINPAAEEVAARRKLPLVLVLGARADMAIMREEIFGPILPIVAYEQPAEAIAYVAGRPRPLMLCWFGRDRQQLQRVLDETHAGSVCVNDTVFSFAVDDLPFGGVGASGMGRYHGHEGFLTFSNAKAVFERPRLNTARLFYPPHGGRLQSWLLKLLIR